MIKDVQHDRSASPLASVSDEIYPETLEKMPDTTTVGVGIPILHPDSHAAASADAERDSFEGFGSFG